MILKRWIYHLNRKKDTKQQALVIYVKKDPNGHKVRDHCHFTGKPLVLETMSKSLQIITGKFRGAAHNICNLKMRSVKDIPVFFHNLGGYDSHIIFKSLNKVALDDTPTVIAKSMEKFVCFKIDKLQFKDTLQFLGSSLDKLVGNLAAKTKNGQKLVSIFPNLDKYFQFQKKGLNY